jgi:hypothetical protein
MKKITPQGVWSSPIEIDLTSFSTENLLENLKKILERIETLKEKIVEIKGTGFSDPVTSSLADLSNLLEENTPNWANKTLNETITGSWTFNSPITVPTIKGLSSNRLLITGRLYGVEISINENSTGTGSFVITKEPSGPGLLFLRSDSGNLGIGTMFPSEKIHVVGNVKANQFISTVPTGTAPLQVSSITKVDNLNADLLDDYNASTNAIIETVAVRDSRGYIAAYGIKGPNSQDLVISGENKGVIIEIDKDSSNNDYFSIRSKGDPVLIIDSGTNNVGISVFSPSEKLEVYGNIKAEKFISTLPTGTAPLQVSSTTLVTNLNSDLLDGYHASTNDYVNTVAVRDSSANLKAGVFISTVTTGTAPFQISSTTKVNNLNADLLDGYDGADFARKAENATITGNWTFSATPSFGSGLRFTGGTSTWTSSEWAKVADLLKSQALVWRTGGGLSVGLGVAGSTNTLYFSSSTVDDNSAPANYPIVFDMENGRIGIGTTGPTEKIDIRTGNIRVDSSAVIKFGDKRTINVYVDHGSDTNTRYYYLGKINSNNGILKVQGIMGGHTSSEGRANVDLQFSARSGFRADGEVIGNIGKADIYVYAPSGDSYIYVYLVTNTWALVNLELSSVGIAVIEFNGTYATSPPNLGTPIFQLSTDTSNNILWVDSNRNVKASRFISTVGTGTAPLQVSSTTKVDNLNADLLDGYDSTDFARKAENATITGNWTFNGDINIQQGKLITYNTYHKVIYPRWGFATNISNSAGKWQKIGTFTFSSTWSKIHIHAIIWGGRDCDVSQSTQHLVMSLDTNDPTSILTSAYILGLYLEHTPTSGTADYPIRDARIVIPDPTNAPNVAELWIQWNVSTVAVSPEVHIVLNGSITYNIATDLADDANTAPTSPPSTGTVLSPNHTSVAELANKLATARTISLGGSLSGSTTFDGSSNVTINASINSGAVGTTQIADGAVTASKLAPGAASKIFQTTIGDGTNSSYTVAHNLNTTNVEVSLILLSTNEKIGAKVEVLNVNQVKISFISPIAANSVKVVVLG